MDFMSPILLQKGLRSYSFKGTNYNFRNSGHKVTSFGYSYNFFKETS